MGAARRGTEAGADGWRTAEDRKSRCSLVRGLRLGLLFEASAPGVGDCVETKRGA